MLGNGRPAAASREHRLQRCKIVYCLTGSAKIGNHKIPSHCVAGGSEIKQIQESGRIAGDNNTHKDHCRLLNW